jgi:predicted transposase YbfD/YdcC
MARITQAQTLEEINETHALAFFQGVLASLPDPRRRQGKRYPLETVVVIALMAVICGSDDAQAMEYWGETHKEWLSTFLEMPHGPPTQDVFLAVFGSLDPKKFEDVFAAWARLLQCRLQGQQIVLDGKTSRRSFDPANGKKAIHTLNAWAVESGIAIGQMNVDSKTNEITAIPELLELLDIRNTTVTTDAIGCQSAVAEAIIAKGADYVLAVKENQPTLLHDIEQAFQIADSKGGKPIGNLQPAAIEHWANIEKGHGRIEERSIDLCRDLWWLSQPEKWLGINFYVRVTRNRTILATGKESTETAYYIGSNANATPETIGHQIRRHWAIENECHFVLDTAFREDEARHRAKNAAKNMTVVRKFALNVIKGDKTLRKDKRGYRPIKLGVANKRKLAGWDKNYLINLLTESRC